MSEYQYYEFRAIDRTLSDQQMLELRDISTRAEITRTSFTNEYHWSGLKAQPAELVEEYFDIGFHFANWGERELILRVPRDGLDADVAGQYEADDCLSIWQTDAHHIVHFAPFIEDGHIYGWNGEAMVSALVPLCEALVRGDLRALYLGWLFSATYGWLGADEPEPPVPAGLDQLDDALETLAEFLELDDAALQVAAEASPAAAPEPSVEELRRWLSEQPEDHKLDWLMRVVRGDDQLLGATIRREYATDCDQVFAGHPCEPNEPRTAGELYQRSIERLEELEARAEEQRRLEEERKRREEQQRRNAYLDEIADQEEGLWGEVEQLVETYKPRDYDAAVEILVDLRDLHDRQDTTAEFRRRLADFKERYGRRSSLMDRMDKRDL